MRLRTVCLGLACLCVLSCRLAPVDGAGCFWLSVSFCFIVVLFRLHDNWLPIRVQNNPTKRSAITCIHSFFADTQKSPNASFGRGVKTHFWPPMVRTGMVVARLGSASFWTCNTSKMMHPGHRATTMPVRAIGDHKRVFTPQTRFHTPAESRPFGRD